MTILITGAAGGFGRLFSSQIERKVNERVVVSDRVRLSLDNYHQCDMESKHEIQALISELHPTMIFHLAGIFDDDFPHCLAVNTMSAKYIFDTLIEKNIATRVILIGSAAEYGIVRPYENPIKEDRILRPVSVYGLTKAYQTQLANYYAYYHGIDVVIARVFNLMIQGLSDRLFVGRVEKMIDQFRKGEIKRIKLGNIDNQRDYVTGEEAIRQIELISTHGRRGEVYHVGSGKPIQMSKLLDQMLLAENLDRSIVSIGHSLRHRSGYDVPIIYADMEKTFSLGGN